MTEPEQPQRTAAGSGGIDEVVRLLRQLNQSQEKLLEAVGLQTEQLRALAATLTRPTAPQPVVPVSLALWRRQQKQRKDGQQ